MSRSPGDVPAPRKRFYKEVTVAPSGPSQTYKVLLDGRGLRTPAKCDLVLPTQRLAEAVAEEWRRQGAAIEPQSMPLTRLVNSAIDGVTQSMQEVRAAIVAYGGTDLLCYLAEGPRELIERQSQQWGEIHAWIKQALGVELELACGVMPVAQPPEVLARLEQALGVRTPIELAALHVMTSLTGSLLLTLAVLHKRSTPQEAWSLAHIDEDFQIERWGIDAEAAAKREQRWLEMHSAAEALVACATVA